LVILTFQVFAQHDATLWQAGSGTPEEERWMVEGKIDADTNVPGLTAVLPPGRGTTDTSASGGASYPPGFHSEGRWRWSTGLVIRGGLLKGKHSFEIKVAGQIYADDPLGAKLGQACGSVSWVAFR
jgi:hypothetical protein